MFPSLGCVLILLFCAPSALLAQELPPPEKKLTFQESVRRALAKNPDFIIEKKKADSSENSLKQKWASFLPSLSAGMSWSQSYPNNNVPVTTQGYGEYVNAGYNLFNGFQDVKGYRRARLDYALEQNTLKKTFASTVYAVKQAYENLRAQQELMTISQGILKLRKDNERLVLLRFQSGRENKGSYMEAQTSTAQAELDLYKSKIDRRNLVRTLARVLDEDGSQDIVVTDEIPTLKSIPTLTPNMEKDHPDYVEVLFQKEQADLDADISKLKFMPKLDFNAGVGINSAQFLPRGDKNWSYGLTLSIPLFDGGSTYLDVLSKENSLAISEINQRKKVVDIRNNLQSNYDALEISKRSYDIAVKKLESMKIREKLSRDRYNIGVMTFDDWNNIVNDLIEAQKNLNSAKKDKVLAEANWISAQGRGDIE